MEDWKAKQMAQAAPAMLEALQGLLPVRSQALRGGASAAMRADTLERFERAVAAIGKATADREAA